MQSVSNKLIPRDLDQLYNLVTRLQPGEIYLLSGEGRLVHSLGQELADWVAVRGPLTLILGGNRYSVDRIPILLGDQVHQIYSVLNRIQLTRAETAYQMLHALESTPVDGSPVFATDFLDSFYEEALDLAEVTRLVERCLVQMRRLCQGGPLFISAAQSAERPSLLELLMGASDHQVHIYPELGAAVLQTELF